MEEPKVSGGGKKKVVAFTVFALVAAIGVAGVYFYRQYRSTRVTTDDAYIEGRIHMVSSKVSGTVKALYAENNKAVKKGDLLVEIDDADYAVKVREQEAALGAEKARLAEAGAKIETAKSFYDELRHRSESAQASLEREEANLRQAESDVARAESLLKKEAVPKDTYDKAKTAHDVAISQVKSAKEQVKLAHAALRTQKAAIRQAESSLTTGKELVLQREAAREAAGLSRSYTRISSPSDGYVTKKSVEAGNLVQPGQPLMAVVPLDDIWVVANYKETQIENIRVGQRVDVRVDAYPGKVFGGRVDGIMAGAGAAFSLFPPENATGNFVKVVQRVPVKIVLDKGADSGHVLRVGMSVVPTVFTK